MTWNIEILITFHTLDVIHVCEMPRSEGQVTLLGLTNKAVGVEGEQARPGWTSCRPEGSVPLSAKDPGPEISGLVYDLEQNDSAE